MNLHRPTTAKCAAPFFWRRVDVLRAPAANGRRAAGRFSLRRVRAHHSATPRPGPGAPPYPCADLLREARASPSPSPSSSLELCPPRLSTIGVLSGGTPQKKGSMWPGQSWDGIVKRLILIVHGSHPLRCGGGPCSRASATTSSSEPAPAARIYGAISCLPSAYRSGSSLAGRAAWRPAVDRHAHLRASTTGRSRS